MQYANGESLVKVYADHGYQGGPDVQNGMVLTPIKKKKSKKITDEQRQYKIHSKILIYVEDTIRRIKT